MPASESEDLLNDVLLSLEDGSSAIPDPLGVDMGFGLDEGKDAGGDLLDDVLDALGEDIPDNTLDIDELNLGDEGTDSGLSVPNDELAERVTLARNGDHEFLSTMSQFTSILSKTGIHGPRHLRAFNLTTRAVRIGRGAQFTVFKDESGVQNENVVIKRVNVPLSRDKDSNKSFASGSDYRLQLRTLELEVLSLCNPFLRSHRNIVHLVAWGYDYPLPDTPVPVLFMEAALMTLTDFLKPENEKLLGNNPNDIKHQLALDFTAGIEALHRLRIVHGDVKPDNVLVFRETLNDKVPFCAKISDFGVCVDIESARSGLTIEDYRGTLAWLAPEVRDIERWSGDAFRPEVMFRFDSYSLGLTILSVFVNQGQPVDLTVEGEDPLDVAISMLRGDDSLPSPLRMQLTRALRSLLDIDPWKRSLPNSDLLKVDSPAYTSWLAISQRRHRNNSADVGMIDTIYNKGPRFWYRLDDAVREELEQQYSSSETDTFAADVLFGMAMNLTGKWSANNTPYVDRVLTYITASARRGFSPARAIYAQFIHAHDRKSEFSERVLNKWTLQAIAEGYLFAKPSPSITNQEIDAARAKFRNAGGFCPDPFLRKLDIVDIARDLGKALEYRRSGRQIVDIWGNTLLHAAAALGAIAVVRGLVEEAGTEVDVLNDNLETPLYKACQAGHVEVIHYLIDKGAKASIATKQRKLTALHWLFTIPESSVLEIASRLVREAGAHVNAIAEAESLENSGGSPTKTMLLHFPFELPSGTPLHWAAFARSKPAMEALLELGANIDSTYQNCGPGTAPLALAAWYGETEIVRFLLSKGADGTATEKGRNSLHALTYYMPEHQGYVPYAWHYWIRHGNWSEHLQQMTELAKLLADAGADVTARDQVYPRRTPIMMAAQERKSGAVCALLSLGADVDNPKGVSGKTVLHEWANSMGCTLAYPESYLHVWKRITEASEDVNIQDEYQETPLHTFITVSHPEDTIREGCDILFNLPRPADPNVADRRGLTPLFIALGTWNPEQEPEKRAFHLIKFGASLFARTNTQADVFFPVANNKCLSDDRSYNLILRLLSHLAETERCEGNISIEEVYRKYFLSHFGAILALAAAAREGRVKTTKLLLDLGLEKRINDVFESDSKSLVTVLDSALHAANVSRQAYMEQIAGYGTGPHRERALASKVVYYKGPGGSARATEAYNGFPEVLRLLRSRGAKRACELEPVPDRKVLSMEDMLPSDNPDFWDVTNMYHLGFSPETQPNKKQWEIVYELARHPADWRDQLVELLRWRYEIGVRLDLDMLRDAEKYVAAQEEKDAAADEAGNKSLLVDADFRRKMLLMLYTIGQPGDSVDAETDKDSSSQETPRWIEVRETKRYGLFPGLNTAPGQVLEVEIFRNGRLGRTRRRPVS
ncbi:hypothetical protein VTO42DRAFT_5963 [Malbranchea cinnamomea]